MGGSWMSATLFCGKDQHDEPLPMQHLGHLNIPPAVWISSEIQFPCNWENIQRDTKASFLDAAWLQLLLMQLSVADHMKKPTRLGTAFASSHVWKE